MVIECILSIEECHCRRNKKTATHRCTANRYQCLQAVNDVICHCLTDISAVTSKDIRSFCEDTAVASIQKEKYA